MIVKCHICEKEFYKRPGEVKKTNHNFCSKKCFGEWIHKYFRHTKEAKQKISKANKGKLVGEKSPMYGIRLFGKDNPNYGKYWTIEQKHRLSIKLKGNKKLIEQKIGSKNPNWKGGKFSNFGYIYKKNYNHPFSTKRNYVNEHRLIMEKHIDRYLKPEEVVHHINGIKDDNRLENLILFANDSKHQKYHAILKEK